MGWEVEDIDATVRELRARGVAFEEYAQPLGLDWDELVALVQPLAGAPNILGVSVADFNPDRDADGTHAARVVEALETVLCPGISRSVRSRYSSKPGLRRANSLH
jgi:hypothetical protein